MSPRPGTTLTVGVAVPELDVEPVDTEEARGSIDAVVPALGAGLAVVEAAVGSEASELGAEEAVTWDSGAAEVSAPALDTRSVVGVLDEVEDVVEAEPFSCEVSAGDGSMRFASPSVSRTTPVAAAVVDSEAIVQGEKCKDGDKELSF